MATRIWRGTATAVPQVDWATPSSLNPGDTCTLTINRRDVSVTARTDKTAQEDLIADIVSKMVTAVGQYSSLTPEFAEISASPGSDDAGNSTHVILTGPTDGKPVTITASAAAVAFAIEVQKVRTGRNSENARQLITPRGTASGGTFDLIYDGTTISGVAYNASAATLQTAINSGKDSQSPSVTVSGPAGGPYTIETSSSVPVLRVDGSSLTGGDFVEVIQGRDGLSAGLTLLITRDSDFTDETQWRLTLETDPGVTTPTAWISSEATADDIAYALLGAGFHAAVRPSGTVGSQWDIELISDLNDVGASGIQATIEAEDDSYTVTEVTRSAVNEVQYLRINATSGNLALGSSTCAVDGADFFSDDATAGSLAKMIKDETGIDNTVSKMGTGTGNTQNLIKVEFENSTEVSPLQITDGTLAGGVWDTVILNMGDPGEDEIQRVSFNRAATGGTFTLTYSGQTTSGIAYNATAATVEAALEALSNIGAGEAVVSGPAGGPWVVQFDGTLGKSELTLMTGASSLTGGNTPAFTLTSKTSSESKYHFDVADNWYNPASPSTPAVPVAGDTLVFRENSVDCLYGLEELDGETLASVIVDSSYTGKIGLPAWTGDYWEYRPRRLKCEITTLEIGRGSGDGSGRLNFNLQAVASTVTVFKTGVSPDASPAVQIVGTSTSNVYRVMGGSVGLGTGDHSDSPAGSSLTIGAGESASVAASVRVAGGTITTVEQTSGTAEIRCSATTLSCRGGSMTIDGAPTFTTVNCSGNILCRSTGTITTLNVFPGGIFDLSSNPGLTITNCFVYTSSTFNDPWARSTLTNGIDLVGCTLKTVTIDAGINKSVSLGTVSIPAP